MTRRRARACPRPRARPRTAGRAHACAAAAPLVTHSWSSPSRTSAGSSSGRTSERPTTSTPRAPGEHRRAERVGQLPGSIGLVTFHSPNSASCSENDRDDDDRRAAQARVGAQRAQDVEAACARASSCRASGRRSCSPRSRSSAVLAVVDDHRLDARTARAGRRSSSADSGSSSTTSTRLPRMAARGSAPADGPGRLGGKADGEELPCPRSGCSHARSSRPAGRPAT